MAYEGLDLSLKITMDHNMRWERVYFYIQSKNVGSRNTAVPWLCYSTLSLTRAELQGDALSVGQGYLGGKVKPWLG